MRTLAAALLGAAAVWLSMAPFADAADEAICRYALPPGPHFHPWPPPRPVLPPPRPVMPPRPFGPPPLPPHYGPPWL